MTIDKAIKHCNEVAEWLKELKRIREQPNRNVRKNVSGLEDDKPECPNCGDDLEKWDEYSYCPNCGQALSWEYPDEDIPEEE